MCMGKLDYKDRGYGNIGVYADTKAEIIEQQAKSHEPNTILQFMDKVWEFYKKNNKHGK